jgi:tetratricopeptide (TPR) repeat protein
MSQARPAQRAGLALRLAVLYGNAGRPDRHLELAEAARDLLADDSDDPALALRIAVEILRAHVDLGHWREGRALADATLHSARSLGDRAAQARVLLARGQIAAILLDQAGAEADYALAEQIETARAAEGAAGLDALNFARAELAQANGAFADASARYQQSFEARLARLGADHPDTLRAQFGMAIAMNFMGRTSAARALYAEVGERTQRVFGPRSEALAVVIAGMATADRRLGHYVEAERGYREALSIHEEIGGDSGSAKAADQLGNLSRMRQDIGDLDAAEELNERAMAIRLRLFGADSPWVALSWQNLADYRLDRGNLPGARVAVDQALRIRRAEFAPGHFLRLISEATLLVIDAREGRELDGSRIDALRQALALAPFNTRLSILQALAAAALATRDTAGSIAAVADELRLLQQRHPEPHPWIGITRLRLAEAMAAADDMGQARAELERAVPTLASTQTAQSPWLTRATRLQQALAAGH